MPDTLMTILLSIMGSTGVATLIQFFINRADKRKDGLKEINNRLDKIRKSQDQNERDLVRLQLILMMAVYPQQEHEIIMLAERYFSKPPVGLGGDWYATSLFNKWLKTNNIAEPEWFNSQD